MTQGQRFEDYVRERQGSLLRTAYLLSGSPEGAQDLLQTALERAWRHWDRISQAASVDNYMHKVLIRTYVGLRRRRWRGEVPVAVFPESAETNSPSDATLDRITMLSALARLPPRQRAVVVLRFYVDLSEAQTAEALGCSVGTVKSQAAKALASLRRIVPVLWQQNTTTSMDPQ